jgi:hypothetical protein
MRLEVGFKYFFYRTTITVLGLLVFTYYMFFSFRYELFRIVEGDIIWLVKACLIR